jgi:hypothetical protein
MSLDHLEEVVNDFSDRDWSWWPFLWLRPERDAHLSLGRIVSLSVLYGVPSSVLMGFGASLMRTPSVSELVFTAVVFPLLFLFTGSVVVAPMWNRRADRLRARSSSRLLAD